LRDLSYILVKYCGVAVVPGSSFFSGKIPDKNHRSNYVRFSFSQKLETLINAVERIKQKLF